MIETASNRSRTMDGNRENQHHENADHRDREEQVGALRERSHLTHAGQSEIALRSCRHRACSCHHVAHTLLPGLNCLFAQVGKFCRVMVSGRLTLSPLS